MTDSAFEFKEKIIIFGVGTLVGAISIFIPTILLITCGGG